MPKGYRKDGTKLGFQKGHTFNKGRHSYLKGETYENVFGIEKAKELKAKIRKRMVGKIPNNVKDGSLYSKDRNKKISKSRKGKTWEEIYGKENAKKFKKLTSERFKNKKQTFNQKYKKRLSQLGEKGSNWQGGKVNKNKQIRADFRWKEWRQKIFERDNFTCQDCGQKGGYLEPHHKKKVSDYPELAYNVDNGITYCLKCHIKNDPDRKQFIKKV